MSGQEEQEQVQQRSQILASASDLAALEIDRVLEKVDRGDDHALEQALGAAAQAAEGQGNEAAARGYRLLAILCTFHLRVEDPGQAWAPRWEGPEGRTYTASDFRGEQNEILASILGAISHPALRARVADVVWYNDRSKSGAAKLAVEAYCELIERRLDGRFKARFEDLDDSIRDSLDWLERALQINAMSGGRKRVPDAIRTALEALYVRSRDAGNYVNFAKVARLGVDYGLIDWARVAPDAEQVASARRGGDYPMAVQEAWNLAAQGYGKLADQLARERCVERSVDETLRMREQVPSASAQAFWTRKAIGELRSARGSKERIKALRAELRDLEDASLDEFGQFSMPIDVSDTRAGAIKLFDDLTLPDILLNFALVAQPPTVQALREQALQSRKTSVLGSLFGSSYADRDGKVVAQTPAAGLDAEPSEEWFKEQALLYLDLRRNQVVGGLIEPARETAMIRFPVEHRHFAAIVSMSPFVPQGHEHLFALGFARFFQGDFGSAAHLLIPQLENSLRFVLRNTNRETSKIKPDLLQEDRSLSGMLDNLREELTSVFGADLVNEIDLLFHHRPGPALRHEMAHGKITAGACYSPTLIYACWFIYRLTCLPLLRDWKVRVAPEIEAACF